MNRRNSQPILNLRYIMDMIKNCVPKLLLTLLLALVLFKLMSIITFSSLINTVPLSAKHRKIILMPWQVQHIPIKSEFINKNIAKVNDIKIVSNHVNSVKEIKTTVREDVTTAQPDRSCKSWSSNSIYIPRHPLDPNTSLPLDGIKDLNTDILGVEAIGRLGNNMFQLVSLLGIARWNNRIPFILDTNPVLEAFEIRGFTVMNESYFKNENATRWERKIEKLPCTFDTDYKNLSAVNKNVNVIGYYLQSWRYFEDVKDDCRCLLTFKPHLANDARDVLQYINNVFAHYINGGKSETLPKNTSIHDSYLRFGHELKKSEIERYTKDLALENLAMSNSTNTTNSDFLTNNITFNYTLNWYRTIIWTPLKYKPTILNSNDTSGQSMNATKSPIPLTTTIIIQSPLKRAEYESALQNINISPDGVVLNNVDPTKPLTFIAVHVRRGDFINNGRLVASQEWLYQGMEIFNRSHVNAVFVICSDDIEWCQYNTGLFPFNMVYIKNRSPAQDLALLSICNHTLFTLGSFGWWAAWMAQGEAIYMRNFTEVGSWLDKQVTVADYFLPHWKGL